MQELSDRLLPRLRMLNNSIRQLMDQQFLSLDLTAPQSFVLHYLALHENEPIYPKDLEHSFQLTHPTVSGLLQRLEAKGFVSIVPDRSDRRCKRLQLTDKARCCEQAIGSAFAQLDHAMSAGMSPAERAELLRLLDLAMQNLQKLETMEGIER